LRKDQRQKNEKGSAKEDKKGDGGGIGR